MKILLLGSGGREHALAWKIRQSAHCEALYIAPGNAGTAGLGENIDMQVIDFRSIASFALQKHIDLLVVGPEEPLVHGIYDFFKNDPHLQHIAVLGPSQAAAQLEGSKAFAKQFMQEFGIPTAAYREFTADRMDEGLQYLAAHAMPVVLKADGLAAGKGVLICDTVAEAQSAFRELLGGKFGAASARVVVEAFLKGIEFSVFVITDGTHYKILPVAKDYKRIGEGDTGLNTGGMGAISNPSFVDAELLQKVEARIIQPTMAGIQARQLVYKGFIFFGLICVAGEPFVIEYNCRMGDPETEAVLPRLQNDLIELMLAATNGTLQAIDIKMDARTAATVVLVSGGYPGDYERGKIIRGLQAVQHSIVFHAGTKQSGSDVLSNGGRVFAITSLGADLQEALHKCYQSAAIIQFEGKYYRRDIGFDL